MRKIKKTAILLTAVMMISVLAGCGKDFDAQGYVQARLDQMFQGDVKGVADFTEELSRSDLEAQHEAVLAGFVDNNILGEMEVGEQRRAEFIEICRQIFMVMRYEAVEAKKIDRKNYEVAVEVAPADIFPRFVEGVKADSEEIMQKAKNGEYKGTEEEINYQMQTEFMRHSQELLQTYLEEVSYGEKIKVILHVKADKNKEFSIINEDLDELIIKILRLDEIQD